MPHTLVVFYATKSCPGYTFIPMAVDQSQTPAGNGLSVPAGFNHVVGAYCFGAHAARARLVSPSLRKWANQYIAPVDAAATPPANPAFQYYDYDSSLPVTIGDEMDAEVDNVTNNEATHVGVWLATSPIEEVNGKIFTAEFTSTTTVAAHAWTIGTLTPTTSLEAGLYQVVGMYAHFQGGEFARLVFPGALNAVRPGCIASNTANLQMPPTFRFGELGIWGVFQAAVLPQVEFFSTAGANSERVFLDLVKGPTGVNQQFPANVSAFQTLYPGNP